MAQTINNTLQQGKNSQKDGVEFKFPNSAVVYWDKEKPNWNQQMIKSFPVFNRIPSSLSQILFYMFLNLKPNVLA